jgi:ubiquinone/menaquinone biosynthesis C-methylase UbiE
VETFKRELKNFSLGKCLDIGTRNGEFLLKLKESAIDYEELLGIDNDEAVILKNKDNGDDIKFIHMDGEGLEFQDNSFDTVCLSNTLHHLKDSSALMAEMKRVLKKDGHIIINEMYSNNQNLQQLTHLELHHMSAEIDQILGKEHYHTYKESEIIEMVKESGFMVFNHFSYMESDEFNKKLIKKIDKIDKTVEKIAGHEDYSKYVKKADEIKTMYSENGILPCTQLIVIGKK